MSYELLIGRMSAAEQEKLAILRKALLDNPDALNGASHHGDKESSKETKPD